MQKIQFLRPDDQAEDMELARRNIQQEQRLPSDADKRQDQDDPQKKVAGPVLERAKFSRNLSGYYHMLEIRLRILSGGPELTAQTVPGCQGARASLRP